MQPLGKAHKPHHLAIRPKRPDSRQILRRRFQMCIRDRDVAVGAYLDITDLLAENAPGLLELIPAGYWDACRVNGRIYGVPTYKDSSITQYFVWDVEVLKELGLEEACLLYTSRCV